MQTFHYDKKELKITNIKLFYSSVIMKFAKSAIFPNTRKFYYRLLGVKIGDDVYISPNMIIVDYSLGKYLSLGNRVAIGPNVTFLISSSPNNSKLKKIFPKKYGPINVKEDCWIGFGVTILPGITIGKFSVVGAGSIVTKDIPPYSVAVGNPARVIKIINKSNL